MDYNNGYQNGGGRGGFGGGVRGTCYNCMLSHLGSKGLQDVSNGILTLFCRQRTWSSGIDTPNLRGIRRGRDDVDGKDFLYHLTS